MKMYCGGGDAGDASNQTQSKRRKKKRSTSGGKYRHSQLLSAGHFNSCFAYNNSIRCRIEVPNTFMTYAIQSIYKSRNWIHGEAVVSALPYSAAIQFRPSSIKSQQPSFINHFNSTGLNGGGRPPNGHCHQRTFSSFSSFPSLSLSLYFFLSVSSPSFHFLKDFITMNHSCWSCVDSVQVAFGNEMIIAGTFARVIDTSHRHDSITHQIFKLTTSWLILHANGTDGADGVNPAPISCSIAAFYAGPWQIVVPFDDDPQLTSTNATNPR